MATKREVMLAGVAAKLAHMIASDAPTQLTPTGTDINSALLLKSNWVIVSPDPAADGMGFQLRPASGQFLHVIRNPSAFGIYIYPDFTEQMNIRTPGTPWHLGAQQTGFFLPSRRQWLCGTMSNDGRTAVTGPAGIGIAAPNDAAAGDLFVGGVLAVAPSQPNAMGRIAFNAYIDSAGTWRYLANGPAFQLRFDATNAQLIMHAAAAGLADQPIGPWSPIPGQPIAIFGPSAVGLGSFQPPADAALSSLFANYICVPWSTGVGGGLAARINFNCYFDTTLALRYAATGPAYRMVFPSAPTGTPGMHLRSAPSGSPDTVLPALTEFFAALAADQITTGQTNIMITTNEAGAVALQQVLIGPANSGPGGTGRALYVAT